jgi:hypothetical protein
MIGVMFNKMINATRGKFVQAAGTQIIAFRRLCL